MAPYFHVEICDGVAVVHFDDEIVPDTRDPLYGLVEHGRPAGPLSPAARLPQGRQRPDDVAGSIAGPPGGVRPDSPGGSGTWVGCIR